MYDEVYKYLVALNNHYLYNSSLYSLGEFYCFRYESPNIVTEHNLCLYEGLKELKAALKKRLVDIKLNLDSIECTIAVGKKNAIKNTLIKSEFEELATDSPLITIFSQFNIAPEKYLGSVNLDEIKDIYEKSKEQIWDIKACNFFGYSVNSVYVKALLTLMLKLELETVEIYLQGKCLRIADSIVLYMVNE